MIDGMAEVRVKVPGRGALKDAELMGEIGEALAGAWPPIYKLMREREERDGITVETRADRLTYAVAAVVDECPSWGVLEVLESPERLEEMAREHPGVRDHYPAGDADEGAEEVRRFAAADLREILEDFEAERLA